MHEPYIGVSEAEYRATTAETTAEALRSRIKALEAIIDKMNHAWIFEGFKGKHAVFRCGRCQERVYPHTQVGRCPFRYCPYCGAEIPETRAKHQKDFDREVIDDE